MNNVTNFALIFIDDNLDIVDIEGYDLTATVDPLPRKMFLSLLNDHDHEITFLAQRESSDRGGLQFTSFTSPTSLWSGGAACPLGCAACSPQDISVCTACNPGYFLWKQSCYIACPYASYVAKDSANDDLAYCLACHYSCKECVGPGIDQCTSCCTSGECGSPVLD